MFPLINSYSYECLVTSGFEPLVVGPQSPEESCSEPPVLQHVDQEVDGAVDGQHGVRDNEQGAEPGGRVQSLERSS